jgi:Rieske Fe-S protein
MWFGPIGAAIEALTAEWLQPKVPVTETRVFSSRWIRVLEVMLDKAKIDLSAYSLSCTHQGCKIAEPDKEHVMGCPSHASAFKVSDGGVVKGPAKKPLLGVKLEVQDGNVMAVGFLD